MLYFFVPLPPGSTLFPYTTLFRSGCLVRSGAEMAIVFLFDVISFGAPEPISGRAVSKCIRTGEMQGERAVDAGGEIFLRSEEHTLNSSHRCISYAVFCLKNKTTIS